MGNIPPHSRAPPVHARAERGQTLKTGINYTDHPEGAKCGRNFCSPYVQDSFDLREKHSYL